MKKRNISESYSVAIFFVFLPAISIVIAGIFYMLFFYEGGKFLERKPVLTPVAEPSIIENVDVADAESDSALSGVAGKLPSVDIPVAEPEKIDEVKSATPIAEAPVTSVVLPDLNNSDSDVMTALEKIDGALPLLALIQKEQLIRKGVRAIHALSEGHIVKEYRPVSSPKGLIEVRTVVLQDADNQPVFALDRANYQRYGLYVAALTALPPEDAAKLYHRYYPLLQQAYQELGLKEPDFHNVLLKALDTMSSSSTIDEDAALKRPSVAYVFSDSDIEAMSTLEKLKWRMGQAYFKQVLQWMQSVRGHIMAHGQPS